jgi:hypothetical protein
MLWGTDLIHHSMPLVGGSILALLLAALCTVLLVFCSRQATLNTISLSLAQMSEQLRLLGQPAGAASAPAEAAPVQTVILPTARWGGWRVGFILLCLMLVILLGVFRRMARDMEAWSGYPLLSPFQAARWVQETPQVEIGGKWYELLGVNDLPVARIIAFSKSLDADTWRKHFDEDMTELLDRLGHGRGATATVQVRDLSSGNVQTLPEVPMTEENRRAILEGEEVPSTQR